MTPHHRITVLQKAWGYTFNQILRNPARLDRYGIVDPRYRETLRGGGDANFNNTFNNSTLSSATAQELINNGYSIAWQPRSGRTQTLRQVQGFTNYTLRRNSAEGIVHQPDVGNVGFETTEFVNQVNRGKITEYPYMLRNLFTTNAETGNRALRVGLTHDQYYQLNMNADDIVVWFTIDQRHAIRNDVVNGYYIYSSGNITYSGAGHSITQRNSTHSSITNGQIPIGIVNEAKLFVNTMIAAYRPRPEPPRVQFTDFSGANEIRSFLVPSDISDAGLLDADGIPVHFRILDTNFSSNKQSGITMSFSTERSRRFVIIDGETYVVNNNQIVIPAGRVGAGTYPVTDTTDAIRVTLPIPNEDGTATVLTQMDVPVEWEYTNWQSIPLSMEGDTPTARTIRRAADDLRVNHANMQSGIPHYFIMPPQVLAAFSQTGANRVETVAIRLTTTSRVDGVNLLPSHSDLIIRRSPLFRMH
jgi:hypothetical protein